MDRSIASLNDIKEKTNTRITAKEAITQLEMVENIKTRVKEDLIIPMKYAAYEVTEVDTTVYLAGEIEGACSRMMHYLWKGNLFHNTSKLMVCVVREMHPQT